MRPVLTVAGILLCVAAVPNGALAAETYVFDREWGSYGTADGQFSSPAAVALNLAGDRLMVADRGNNRVQEFSLNGAFIRSAAMISGTPLASPVDVMCDSQGKWYIQEWLSGRVVKCTNGFGLIAVIGSPGSEPGMLGHSEGLWVDRLRNRLYVADETYGRVSVWRWTGLFHSLFASSGSGSGQLSGPTDVATDSAGNIYVAEYSNGRVQKFSPTYDALGSWDAATTAVPFETPFRLHVDEANYVYVSDYDNHHIYKFTTSGTLVTVFGGYGNGPGEFYNPYGFVTDNQGRLYVADNSNNRIQRLVRNQLPTAPTTVTISPTSPRDNQALRATASGATDADGETLTYMFRWYSSPDGSSWTNRKVGPTLSSALTVVGEQWKVAARAYDGRSYGPWRQSAPVTIQPAAGLTIMSVAAHTRGQLALTLCLSAPAEVGGQVLNAAGRAVAALPSRQMQAGTSTLVLPRLSATGTRLPPGRYLVRLTASEASGQCAAALAALELQ